MVVGKFVSQAMGKAQAGASAAGISGFSGWSATADIGLNTVGNLHAGDSLGTSLLKGAGSAALWASNPALMGAYTFGGIGIAAVGGAARWTRQQNQWWDRQFDTTNVVGGNYQDTMRAQTMRQAAVQAIQGSKMNARSALGGEARILSPWDRRR